MKKVFKIIGIGLLGFFLLIIILATAFPTKPELEITSFKNNDEVTTENLGVSGKYKGNLDKILVNGQEAEKKPSGEFSTIVKLQPGENKIKAEAYSKGKVVYTTESLVFFNLEGKLYLEKQKEFSKTPEYETVRKQTEEDSLSAIIYADVIKEGKVDEFGISQIVKEVKDKNQSLTSISLLIFSKDNKQKVEVALEDKNIDEGIKNVGDLVLANYEKSPEGEELFYYPNGLSGEKLALEVL